MSRHNSLTVFLAALHEGFLHQRPRS